MEKKPIKSEDKQELKDAELEKVKAACELKRDRRKLLFEIKA